VSIGLAVVILVFMVYINDGTVTFRDLMPLFALTIAPLAIFVLRIPLRYVLLAAVVFDIPFAFDIYLGWNPAYGHIGTIAGFNLSITTFAILGLYVLWFLDSIFKKRGEDVPHLRLSPAGIPLLLYVIVTGLSIFSASEAWFTIYEVNLLIQMFFLFLYIASTFRTQQDVLALISIMLIVFCIEGLYLVWQRFGPTRAYILAYANDVYNYRVYGHLVSPNIAGAYFSFGLTISLALLLMPVRYYYKLLGVVAFGITTFALFLTLSRGGWAAAGISIGVLSLFMVMRGWLSIRIPTLIVIIGLVIMMLFPDIILTRLFGDDGGAAEGRFPLNELAIDMATDNLLLGVGANNFAYVMPDYLGPEFTRIWVYTVHNKYLLVWSEVGTFGLISFVSFLLVTLGCAWRVWRIGHRFYSVLALALLGAVAGHAVHLSVDIFNNRPIVQMLWMFSGLIMALYAMTREKNKVDTHSRFAS
jgi:O-antigen ligase